MENLNKRPSKGILRFSEGSSRSNSVEKDIKWDEANIKETLHPDDKDYGFMRIDEPPTPYSRSPHGHSGEESDEDDTQAKTNDLLERVSRKIKEPPVTIENVENLGLDESELDAIEKQDLDDETMNGANLNSTTISEDAFIASTSHRRSSSSRVAMLDESDISRASGSSSNVSDFELKRKRHYNEFHAVRLAKKLMQKELDDKNDDDNEDDDDADDQKAKGNQKEGHQDEDDNDGRRHQDDNIGGSSGNELPTQKDEDVCFEESST